MDESEFKHLVSAIIEAARHLVHNHVESWLTHDKANNRTVLEISIHPNETTSYGAVFDETDSPLPDTLFGALSILLSAIDAYDDWETEQSS